MIRAAFFDLGGTLFRYGDLRVSFDGFLRDLLVAHGIEATPERARAAYREAMGRQFAQFLKRSYYLHRDLFEAAHRDFLEQFGARVDPGEGVGRLYEGQIELGLAEVRPRPRAAETLAGLRERGLHVSIVSNIDDDQFHQLWPRMGMVHLVDATTTSEEARSCKPHRGIFEHALRKAGEVKPSEVLFVGDSPHHDVAGARALGMRTALIVDREPAPFEPGGPQPDHVIRELPELLDLVPDARA